MRVLKDIKYSDIGHERQILDLYLPDTEKFPVFIYIHGGGIVEGDKTVFRYINQLVEKGIAVVSANYRLYPTAKFPEFIEDAAAAVAWTKKNISNYGETLGFYICGSSAGGYITEMLCFDKKYLGIHNIDSDSINGYFFDAGQPTTHFHVLKEKGLSTRKIVIDESAPLYFVDSGRNLPPIKIIVSDNDMANRLEQTQLLVSTLKHFGYDMNKVDFQIIKNSTHCAYLNKLDEKGESVFAKMIYDFIKWCN